MKCTVQMQLEQFFEPQRAQIQRLQREEKSDFLFQLSLENLNTKHPRKSIEKNLNLENVNNYELMILKIDKKATPIQ